MTTYYFDVFDGRALFIDAFGDDSRDTDEASDHAVSVLVNVVNEALPRRQVQDFAIAVRGDDGRDVCRAALVFRDTHPDPNQPVTSRDASPPLGPPSVQGLVQRAV